ncbi:portal protein [Xanthomonas phage XaC1]|nr:portal protein [Xanthomonas phage XaC1]
MSSWKRHMTMSRSKITTNKKGDKEDVFGTGSSKNYSSYLPAVYTGLSNRTDRYRQYDQMDQDPEISTALDILTDFCTQNTEDYDIPFQLKYKDDMGDTEVITLESMLDSWCTLNDIKIRIYNFFRSYIKYGDIFFVRDPETYELLWIDPANVDKVTVNESTGKIPVIYYMRDISLNVRDKVLSNVNVGMDRGLYAGQVPNSMSGGGMQYGSMGGGGSSPSADTSNPYSTSGQLDVIPVAAEHVVHISLNPGTDAFWPFGTSILETVFKTYKQKELLEDSIIIYRVQRAPERRVFKIDVGDMPAHQALSYVERMKNEIHQRRIPSNKGGSTSLMDAAYNPLSMLEDYFFPQTADGRGSSVETLPGGENLGQIDDLRWFNNKLIRGLKIPSSYLPFGPEDGGTLFGDGGVGKALIQEHRFNKACMRWQTLFSKVIDQEFKRYLIANGLNIPAESFEVNFIQPMNFAAYRKAEYDQTMISTYAALNELPYVAKQTILKRMGWTQEEIVENERLLLQENPKRANKNSGGADDQAGLQSVGISAPNEPDMDLGANPEDTEGLGASEGGASPIPGGAGLDPNSVGGSF